MKYTGNLTNRSKLCAACAFVVSLLLSFSVLFIVPNSASAQDYRLQPGDTLRMSMPGLTAQAWESTIDNFGQLKFPFIGDIPAQGRTISQLTKNMNIRVSGLEFAFFDNGRRTVTVLSGEELYLEILRYKPVTIVGDVARPGDVEFAPGLTVRRALGIAGGIRTLDLGSTTRSPTDAIVRLQTAIQTQSWVRSQVMINELLLKNPEDGPVITDADRAALIDLLGDSEAEETILQIEIQFRERELEKRELSERIRLTENRVQGLEAAFENYTVSSQAEEERLRAVIEMGEKGLVTVDRVNNARSAALSASTRLLTVESDIFEAKADLQRFKEELAGYDDSITADILADKRRSAQRYAEVSAQVAALQQTLLSDDILPESLGEPVVSITIFRGIGENETAIPGNLGDIVNAGDTIQVTSTISN